MSTTLAPPIDHTKIDSYPIMSGKFHFIAILHQPSHQICRVLFKVGDDAFDVQMHADAIQSYSRFRATVLDQFGVFVRCSRVENIFGRSAQVDEWLDVLEETIKRTSTK